MTFSSNFDVIIVNNDLQQALGEAEKIVSDFAGERKDGYPGRK